MPVPECGAVPPAEVTVTVPVEPPHEVPEAVAVAVNAGDPREARLMALPAPEIRAPERDDAAPVRPQPQPLSPWLIGLALIALLIDWWRAPR